MFTRYILYTFFFTIQTATFNFEQIGVLNRTIYKYIYMIKRTVRLFN